MNNDLISKLSKLKMERKYLSRALDSSFLNPERRRKYFERIDEIDKEINNIKFKMKLERQIKNEK